MLRASQHPKRGTLSRRQVLAMALSLPVAGLGGCLQQNQTVRPELEIFIVDKTSRIQVFDRDGNFIRNWRTPACVNGKPCGLSISHDGLLIVPDTHYFRVLFYTYEGEMVEARTIGGSNGRGPGEFGFLTDVVQDSKHNYYVTEYGDYDRIQKFDPEGSFLCQWGSHGTEPGEFLRPQGLFIDGEDQLWIADAANHRVQIYDLTKATPTFVRQFGADGSAAGQMRGFAFDSTGAMHVIDSYNHRVQRFENV